MNKFGCYDKLLLDGYWVTHVTVPNPDHLRTIGKQIYIKHTMTKDCQWSKTHTSERCDGCSKQHKGE